MYNAMRTMTVQYNKFTQEDAKITTLVIQISVIQIANERLVVRRIKLKINQPNYQEEREL